jgi:hypothetical protein
MTPDYEEVVAEDIILIKDLDKGGPSVTNHVEDVVKTIAISIHDRLGIPLRNFRLVYMDSSGRIDGIRTSNNRFAGFYSIGAQTLTDAIPMVKRMEIDADGNLLS